MDISDNSTPLLHQAFTVASNVDDICSDIQFRTEQDAVDAAKTDQVQAFSFQWDGLSSTSIQDIVLIHDATA